MRRRRRLHPKKRKPPFTIAAAVVGIAAAGYGAYSSSKNQKGSGGKSTSTSEQVYPEQTTQLFRDVEKPLLQGSQAEQQSMLQPFISGSPYSDFLMQQYGSSSAKLAQGAVKAGGASAGIADTGQGQLDLQGLPPVLVNALKQLAFQNASQRTTAVPAGYGNFLAPSTSTKSESTGAKQDPVATGFALGSSVAGLASNVASRSA
jgi:hypothetical protein